MASKAEVLTTRSTQPKFAESLKVQAVRIRRAVRGWASEGQLGSPASTEMARYTGAHI